MHARQKKGGYNTEIKFDKKIVGLATISILLYGAAVRLQIPFFQRYLNLVFLLPIILASIVHGVRSGVMVGVISGFVITIVNIAVLDSYGALLELIVCSAAGGVGIIDNAKKRDTSIALAISTFICLIIYTMLLYLFRERNTFGYIGVFYLVQNFVAIPGCIATAYFGYKYLPNQLRKQEEYKKMSESNQPTLKEDEIERLSKMFISPKEKFIATLGNNYIENFIMSGFSLSSMSQGIAVLTDVRLYFRGTAFQEIGLGKGFKSVSTEQTVSMSDVTGTKYQYINPVAMLISGIIFAFIALTILSNDSDIFGFIGAFFLIIAITQFARYIMNKRTLFIVEYAGGFVGFDVKWFTKSEIDEFQRLLIITKDQNKENNIHKAPETEELRPYVNLAETRNINKADELKKYVDLLNSGAITKEEFETLKADIINK